MKKRHQDTEILRSLKACLVVFVFAIGGLMQVGASGAQEPEEGAVPSKLVVWMPAYIQTAVDFMRESAAQRFPETEVEITPYPAGEYPVKMTSAFCFFATARICST
mgnify:CR=1 FL=1